jgi:Tol biopolymer transport system component
VPRPRHGLAPLHRRELRDPANQGDPGRWRRDVERGTRVRITFDEDAHNPLWNPATGGVVFRYDEGSTFYIAERRADGTGDTRTLYAREQVDFAPTSISADGRWLLVNALVNERDIWAVDLESGGEPRPFVSTPFREQDAAMSPDSRWVAYTSDESGRDEIYVVSWPDASDRQQISVAGGHDSSWSRDGARLYFLKDQQMMAVAMTPGADLTPGLPTVAFAGNVDGSNYNHAYDVMPGGDRAVWIGRPEKAEDQADLRVVSGWRREVLERLGDKN